MVNSKISEKHVQRYYMNKLNEMRKCIAHQEETIKELAEQIGKQQEILGLYYKEYQELKKQNEKQYLMTYIRMRESMLKDMAKYKQNNQTNTTGYQLLSMYVNEFTEMLEDHGVEIIDCSEAELFDPIIQKPIERIAVSREEYNNVVCKVFSSGYRWNGIVLKKIDVAVGIFR